jgi:hypothetical protein
MYLMPPSGAIVSILSPLPAFFSAILIASEEGGSAGDAKEEAIEGPNHGLF